MSLFCAEHKLSDVVFYDPSVITLLNRFGIFLGVGDNTIGQACANVNKDVDFFLAILNTYLFEDYFPESELKSFSIEKIVDYLSKTDQYYVEFQLPNIERHFNSLVIHNNAHSSSNNLPLLRKFFEEMSRELMGGIEFDRSTLFPSLLKDAKVKTAQLLNNDFFKKYAVSKDVEEKISDLLSFFVIHLNGIADQNLCRAVVVALFTMQKDIKQNNRIRERILLPLLEDLYGAKL
jgi:regulator of cell morphogenesis and NO signaling